MASHSLQPIKTCNMKVMSSILPLTQRAFRAARGGQKDGGSQVPLHPPCVWDLRGPAGPRHGVHGDRLPGDPAGHRAAALGAALPHHPRDCSGNELPPLYEPAAAPPGPEACQHPSGRSLSRQGRESVTK